MELHELEELRRAHDAQVHTEGVDDLRRRVAQLLETLETTIIERDAARAAGVEVVRTIRTTPPPSELDLSV